MKFLKTLGLVVLVITMITPKSTSRLHAQSPHRWSLTVGPTVLPFDVLSGATVPAAIVAGRVAVIARSHWNAGISVGFITPLMGTSVAADCIPDVPCPTFQSPTALYNASADIGLITIGRRIRTSLGAGFISAQNLSDNTCANSPTVEAGVEYTFLPARRVSPVVSVRMQRLTRKVGGLDFLVLPTFGIVF